MEATQRSATRFFISQPVTQYHGALDIMNTVLTHIPWESATVTQPKPRTALRQCTSGSGIGLHPNRAFDYCTPELRYEPPPPSPQFAGESIRGCNHLQFFREGPPPPYPMRDIARGREHWQNPGSHHSSQRPHFSCQTTKGSQTHS